jgi:glycosyltransferase involved in cell wall biosynthesis
MIVKNEKKVINTCLESVIHLIDYWVIVDTGSSDGTQQLVREYLKKIPGELVERPWVNFEHNRNEALHLTKNKGDYILFLDADHRLVINQPLDKDRLLCDYYLAHFKRSTLDLSNILLIKNDFQWRWSGILHESISHPAIAHLQQGYLTELFVDFDGPSGHRSDDPNKFQKDIEILQRAIQKEPTNSRYIYYLAQSYLCAKKYSLALDAYEKRSEMGGDPGEVFWSLFSVGILQHSLKMDDQTVIDSYCKAFLFDQSRLEPLYNLSHFFSEKGLHLLSYLVAKMAVGIVPQRPTHLYISSIYNYEMQHQFALSAEAIGHIEEAQAAYQQSKTTFT